MNWGGFAGGLASGIATGIKLTDMIDETRKKQKREDVLAKANAEAQAHYNSQLDSRITEGSPQAATIGITGKPAETAVAQSAQASFEPVAQSGEAPSNPAGVTAPSSETQATPQVGAGAKAIAAEESKPITPQTAEKPIGAQGLPFVFGGKGYATRDEARRAAAKEAPSFESIYAQKAVPFMRQKFIEMGEIDAAEKIGKWAEETDNKEYARNWFKADQALRSGDIKAAGKHFIKMYRKFDDGIDLAGDPEEVKDENGNITAFKINLKNSEGKEYSQIITPRDMQEKGLGMLSPIEKFKLDYEKQSKAEEIAAKSAADTLKDERDFRQQKELKGIEHGNALERMSIQKGLDSAQPGEFGKKLRDAKREGVIFSPEEIKALAKGSVSEVGKAPHPDALRLQVYNKLAENQFARYSVPGPGGATVKKKFSEMSPEEGRALIDLEVSRISSALGETGGAAGAPSAGLPAAKKGVPFFDTKTNSVVYR